MVQRNGILIVVQRQCFRCNRPFTVTPQRRRYCSDACVEAASERRCARCGSKFPVQKGHPGRAKKYCSDACREALAHKNATARGKASAQRRSEASRTLVTCIWPDCPRPEDLIALPRYKAKQMSYHRHPECRAAYRRACNGGTTPRRGAELVCEDCGDLIGYRKPSRLYQKYCGKCSYRRQGGDKPRTGGEWRICTLGGCMTDVWVSTWRIKKSKTGNFFCTPAHAGQYTRAPRIHCRSCGCEQVLQAQANRHPRTLDLTTLTFVCRDCQPQRTIMRGFTCARVGCGKYFRRRVPIDAPPDLKRFCAHPCRKHNYRVERLCDVCDKVIPASRRNKAQCSRECYKQAKQGRPNPHYRPSQAELNILAAVREKGKLPVRNLAALTGASPTTVHKTLHKHNIA